MAFTLKRARAWDGSRPASAAADLAVHHGRVTAAGRPGPGVDLHGRTVIPGLVNGHDHLGFSTFPRLGRPPYASLYEWAADVRAGTDDERARRALAVPLRDRLLLGGLRNLICGVTAVVHHDAWHSRLDEAAFGSPAGRVRAAWRRACGGCDFPVRVLRRYALAHSPGLQPQLERTRPRSALVPWMLHAGEGTTPSAERELRELDAAGWLRPNTVVVHAVAAGSRDAERLAATGAAVVWCPESNRQLYGATAPVAALRAAGARLGLGSDSPLSGVRDPLSNLAAARREGVMDDAALLRLATRETAAVFALPVGRFVDDAPADLAVLRDVEGFLRGERLAVQLVLVAGRPLYGSVELMDGLGVPSQPLFVDGEERRLEARLAREVRRVLAVHPQARASEWLQGVRVG